MRSPSSSASLRFRDRRAHLLDSNKVFWHFSVSGGFRARTGNRPFRCTMDVGFGGGSCKDLLAGSVRGWGFCGGGVGGVLTLSLTLMLRRVEWGTALGDFEGRGVGMRVRVTKIQVASAVLVIAAVPAFGQMTGVSNPDPAVITATPDVAPKPAAKPSPAIPADAPAAEVYGGVCSMRYHAPGTAAAAPSSKSAYDPDANFVTSVKSRADEKYSGFVTSVPEKEGEIREGTLLKVKIRQTLSTARLRWRARTSRRS